MAGEAGVDGQVRDRGVSVLELVLSLALMGVIATVLLAVVTTFLRNDASASQRIDESRDLQQLSAYFPLDVSSAFMDELLADSNLADTYLDATNPATASPCSGWSGGGSNVLTLKWSETFGGSLKQYRVQYRTQVVDDETRLLRLSCSGTTLGTVTTRIVARQLRDVSPVSAVVNGGLVRLTLYENTGRTLTISGTTQNPHAELDPMTGYDD